ncbi:unnamed protein product [Lymnaea stagnalis]|uniref:Uncharacterized protein n=1 Tax=Lymnaea stagnalis TaxID=6523 RepID=A0AAV2HG96_LYMST
MALPVNSLLLVLTVMFVVSSYGDMYYKQPSMMMMGRPGKVIHVHHYDAGMSNNHMSSSYKKHDSGGSSLIELLILSSLLGGTGLTGTTGTQTAVVNGQLVPIQNG